MSTQVLVGRLSRAREFETIDPEATIAVLPVAAIEQHGPHLPVSTDFSIMNGMLETVFPLLPDRCRRPLPAGAGGGQVERASLPAGNADHSGADADRALDASSALRWRGQACARFVFVNSHGGNEEIMGIVARELRVAMHDDGGEDFMDALRPAGRHVWRAGAAVRHPWRRRRDIADAAFPSGNRGHAASRELHLARGGGAQGVQPSCAYRHALPSPGSPPISIRKAWSGEAKEATADKGTATALHQASGICRTSEAMSRRRGSRTGFPAPTAIAPTEGEAGGTFRSSRRPLRRMARRKAGGQRSPGTIRRNLAGHRLPTKIARASSTPERQPILSPVLRMPSACRARY